MKVLFTHSYFLRFDAKQWKLQQPYAPLGTITAAAVLRTQKHEVKLFDSMFADQPQELAPHLNWQPELLVIYDDGFNYLTKMCLTNMREAAFVMIALAKEKNITTVICSSDSTDRYDLYLDQGADFIIAGEGEVTLTELVTALEQEKNYHDIQGLIYRENRKTICNPKREVIKLLDEIPIAAWDLINLDYYSQQWIKKSGYFSINLSTTRGCPFKCNWCAKPIYGNRYHARSPKHVVMEIKLLQSILQFDHIWFCDDIFGLKPGWVKQFADELDNENLKLQFKIQSRVDLLLEENNIIDLARAGCSEVWVGAESGSQQILDAMDKGTKVEQIHQATFLLKKHNIKVAFFLQFGYPGETLNDIHNTINMVQTLMPDDIGVSVSYPLPGTIFHTRVKKELIHKTNWKDSDEMAIMFNNTYPSRFYKILQRYLHRKFRSAQAIKAALSILSKPSSLNTKMLKRALSFLYQKPGEIFHRIQLNYIEKRF